MYLLLLGLVLAGAITEYLAYTRQIRTCKKISSGLFIFNCGLMLYMMLFRYGQRADYWQYRALYNEAPFNRGFPLFWYTREMHSEVGFRFLINLFTCWDCPPIVFYGVVSCLTIVATIWAVTHYCTLKNLALLLIVPTLYLSYYMSGIRNGLAVAIALAVLPKMLYQHRYGQYCVIVLLLSSIHISSLIYLLLIPIQYIRVKWLMLGVPFCALLGGIISYTPIKLLIAMIPGLARLGTDLPSYMGILERTCMFLIITGLYHLRKRESIKAEYRLSDILYRGYLFGYVIALITMTSAYISQRLTMPLKSIEILLIPLLIVQCERTRIKNMVLLFVGMITIIMTLKNLNASMSGVNLFTYSYISIWDGPDVNLEEHMDNIRRWSTNVYTMVEEGTWTQE